MSAADFRLASLAHTAFDWQAALSQCLASELAYGPAAKVKAQALAWGFQGCAFLDNQAAQGFVAWSAEGALVTFRGTESTADWLSNLRLSNGTIPGAGQVHAGFLGQFRALQPQLEKLLDARPTLPLVMSGHSLGGAIAVLAAITWAGSRPLRTLYTYGQPAVAMDKAAAIIGATLGGRHHSGHLVPFDGQGRVTSQEASPSGVPAGSRGGIGQAPMLTPAEFETLQRQPKTGTTPRGQEGLSSLIKDHMLSGYLRRIRQQMG